MSDEEQLGKKDVFKDTNRFGGRLKRYAKVSTSVGGAAAKIAGNRIFGINLDKDDHAQDLRAALGGLKGPLMKVAQIASTMPDAMPSEYAAELSQLQSDAPAMGWSFVRRRMATELGAGWRKQFTDFSREAVAAASLGQVHAATTSEGQKLACKLQYPDMASAVEADLGQLKLIFGLFKRYDKAIDPGEIYQEVGIRLREELDYTREACNMKLYEIMMEDLPHIHVPQCVNALSTDRLLTMTWLDGKKIIDFEHADQELRNELAVKLFRAWYTPFFKYGIIHGDPHPGNYTVDPNHDLNLMDFGCIRVFPAEFIGGVIDLYKAIRDKDRAATTKAFGLWGFEKLDEDMVDTMSLWANFLFEAWIEDTTRPLARPGQKADGRPFGADVAREVHQRLKEQGGITPPREFVMMDRAAVGLGSIFLRLGSEVNWHRMIEDLISDFDVDAVAARQKEALEKSGLMAKGIVH